jgi:hypothetical protein
MNTIANDLRMDPPVREGERRPASHQSRRRFRAAARTGAALASRNVDERYAHFAPEQFRRGRSTFYALVDTKKTGRGGDAATC